MHPWRMFAIMVTEQCIPWLCKHYHYCEINHSSLFAMRILLLLYCYCVCRQQHGSQATAFIPQSKCKNNNIFLKYNFQRHYTVMLVENCILKDCYFIWINVYWAKLQWKRAISIFTLCIIAIVANVNNLEY